GRGGGPVGEARVVLHQPVERHLHDHEGGGGLHNFTEGHGPGDVLGGAEENGNDGGKAVTTVGHNGGANILHHHFVPARADGREGSVKAGALLVAPAQHRDALAVFPEAREHVAVVCLRLILVLGN